MNRFIKILLVLKLQILKNIVGRRQVVLKIRGGPIDGFWWSFNSKSNNEFILGKWEEMMQDTFAKYLKVGHVLYDLGAHQGYLSLIGSKIVGEQGHVFSFEALPNNFDLLTENMRLNNITNCSFFNTAVSNRNGYVSFTCSESDVANTYISVSPAFQNNTFVEIPARKLDDLYNDGLIRPPDFIKIDVEGAELDVLLGSLQILKTFEPTIYLETHDIHNPDVDSKCKQLLSNLGYSVVEEFPTDFPGKMASYIFKYTLE